LKTSAVDIGDSPALCAVTAWYAVTLTTAACLPTLHQLHFLLLLGNATGVVIHHQHIHAVHVG
jgi:hypothetical protein